MAFMKAAAGGVALRAACKDYSGRRVLSDVSLEAVPGRIHALVGENGAGKSTALSILAGLVQPDGGTVAVAGKPVTLAGRMAAIAAGVGLVPQHLSLLPDLTLVENLALTHPDMLVRRSRLRTMLMEAAQDAGLVIQPDIATGWLGFAERQLGELAIALAQGARTLLLDEPTSAIGPYETGQLFDRLRTVANEGAAIVVVTHRIDEVRRYADDVTVLSQGKICLQTQTDAVDDAALVRAMVGHIPDRIVRRPPASVDAPRLEMTGVSVPAGPSTGLRDISLSVSGGEIFGVLGIAGNGQRHLAEVAAGMLEPESGCVLVDGADIGGGAADARRHGVSYVPEERHRALLPQAPLSHSALTGRRIGNATFTRHGMLRWDLVTAYARDLILRHDVRPPDPRIASDALSGGNQQKFLVGRELDDEPSVVVLHGPTQGLDLQAAAAIRNAVRATADNGAAVLLISADVDEVLELSDRVGVLSHGHIVDVFPVDEYDRDRVGRAMAGLVDGFANLAAGTWA
jgi:general nucleoside transport system ATP-binding protein